MKRICFTIIYLLFLVKPLLALPLKDDGDRSPPDEPLLVVTNFGDHGPGTLRALLGEACQEPGNDEIRFGWSSQDRILISLETPLEIPADCEGEVVLVGHATKETILDGSEIGSGEGILVVRSTGNLIRNLTVAGYREGAGIVLEGNDNTLIRNRIGERVGSCPGIQFPSGDPEDLPTFVREISNEKTKFPFWPIFGWLLADCGNEGAGILVTGDRNLIGGEETADGNRILFNRGGGIVITGGGFRNRISKNVIAHNEGSGIELEEGANGGIQPLSGFGALPLEPETGATAFRYTLFGQAGSGGVIDLYQVALGEEDDQGEGAKYLESFAVGAAGGPFFYTLERDDLPPGSRISAIVCDDVGNCSEFSPNATLGRDSDHDGLLDPIEDSDGDWRIDAGESDPLLNDTDRDGLPDPMEDQNQNGIVEAGETDPGKTDSDDDGISDFVETGGDGNYDSADGDTDPLNPDTDGDGLLDGEEDKNQNGLIELGETDPNISDTSI